MRCSETCDGQFYLFIYFFNPWWGMEGVGFAIGEARQGRSIG